MGGRTKIPQQLDLIQDQVQRNITYCKRKKCLVKKAMEMSMLCGQDVSLVIHDRRKSKLVMFRSSEDINTSKIDMLINSLSQNDLFENYTNKNYGSLCETKIVTCQAREWLNYHYKNTDVVVQERSMDYVETEEDFHELSAPFSQYLSMSEQKPQSEIIINRRQEKQMLKLMQDHTNTHMKNTIDSTFDRQLLENTKYSSSLNSSEESDDFSAPVKQQFEIKQKHAQTEIKNQQKLDNQLKIIQQKNSSFYNDIKNRQKIQSKYYSKFNYNQPDTKKLLFRVIKPQRKPPILQHISAMPQSNDQNIETTIFSQNQNKIQEELGKVTEQNCGQFVQQQNIITNKRQKLELPSNQNSSIQNNQQIPQQISLIPNMYGVIIPQYVCYAPIQQMQNQPIFANQGNVVINNNNYNQHTQNDLFQGVNSFEYEEASQCLTPRSMLINPRA